MPSPGDLEPLARVGVGAWAARKLIGPTLELLGKELLPSLTERGLNNLGRVLQNGYDKLGSRADEDGQVPPRVLKAAVEEGLFAEDEIVVEYLGGVLASSRGGNTRDDRGVAYLALVSRLSAYDLRLHYIMYSALHQRLVGQAVDLGSLRFLMEPGATFLPLASLNEAMDFTSEEGSMELLDHSVVILHKEGLISEFACGPDGYMSETLGVAEGGVVFTPSALGIHLFLWAHGLTRFEAFLEEGTFGAFVIPPVPDAKSRRDARTGPVVE
jgi:hypothetical protein